MTDRRSNPLPISNTRSIWDSLGHVLVSMFLINGTWRNNFFGTKHRFSAVLFGSAISHEHQCWPGLADRRESGDNLTRTEEGSEFWIPIWNAGTRSDVLLWIGFNLTCALLIQWFSSQYPPEMLLFFCRGLLCKTIWSYFVLCVND